MSTFVARPINCVGSANPSVWSLKPLVRGRIIESGVTAEYKAAGWYALDEGTGAANFDLVDFQRGNNLASLKTVDTNGSTWMGRMESHITDLATRGATVDGNPANMILDIRVQPGGAGAAQPLIQFGRQNGVTVVIKEYP